MFSHKGIFLIFLWNFRRRWLLLFLNSLLEIFFLLCAKWFTRFYMKCCLKSKSIYCLWTVVRVLWFLIFLDGRRLWHLHLLRIYTCKRLSWHWSVLHTCFSWNRREEPPNKSILIVLGLWFLLWFLFRFKLKHCFFHKIQKALWIFFRLRNSLMRIIFRQS